jgi:tetratricopeptide (TPR) repeat protein
LRRLGLLVLLLAAGPAGCAWLGFDTPDAGRTPEPPPPPDLREFTRVSGELVLPTGKVTYDCGPEALTCVLRYYGKDVTVDQITAQIYNPDLGPHGGTVSTQLAPLARQLGLAARLAAGTIGRLKARVDRGEPSIIMIRVRDDLHHFYVVGGYSDSKQMILCEEYSGLKRAIAYRELNELWEPAGFFLLEVSPSTAESDYRLGTELEAQGRTAEALAQYQKALARDPVHQPSLVGVGNCQLALGRREAAVETYRHALKLHENDPRALNNLAHALWERGDALEEARRLADRAVAIYIERLDGLRRIEKTQPGPASDADGAREIRRRINEAQTELALAYGTLAAVRFALKEHALAISAWKASYDLLDLSATDLRARRLLMIARAYQQLNVRSQWKSYLEEALRVAQDENLKLEIQTELGGS